MKKLLLIFVGLSVTMASWAQTPRIDSVAVMILNHMSDIIGDLNSCSFKVATSSDVLDYDYGTIKQSASHDVYMVGPDKMLVHTNGEKGHIGYWYNGEQVTYYSFTDNNYATVEAPSDIMTTIGYVNLNYGVEFPAADFFYPTFTDDVLSQYTSVLYAGMKDVDGQQCFHIVASNQYQTVQFWIANGAYSLPAKFVITFKNDDNMQYEATLSEWKINPDIPYSVFEFLPPPSANQISLLPITSK